MGMVCALMVSCQLPSEVETPTLYAPEQNVVVATAYPYFDWGGVDDVSYYQLQVDDASSFDNPVIDLTVLPSEYEHANPLDDGDYWWRVRAWLCTGGS